MTADQSGIQLKTRLAEELGTPVADSLVAQLAQLGGKPEPVAATVALLEELGDLSDRAARAAIEVLPDLCRRGGLDAVVAWLDLGIALAEASGATALKYFKDSPRILGLVDTAAARQTMLGVGLELAEQDANVTLEYLRTAPQMLSVLPADQLGPWLDIGVELVQIDVVAGLEYIRQIAAIAPVLDRRDIRTWVSFGMKLIQPNTIGKPDYLATIEFLRTSPAILGDIEEPAIRSRVVSVGACVAEQAPASAIAWLAEAPSRLRALPSSEWRMKIIQYAGLLAERDAETALAYLRRAPDMVGLIGAAPDAVARFETWFKTGMEVLAYSVEGARAYFGLESQQSLASVETALSGVPLRQVARTLKLFVQGLCGADVMIQALPDSAGAGSVRATVSPDGRTIALPALLRRCATAEENRRLYLVMAAHEAGHLEFGTYQLTLAPLHDLIAEVCARYGRGDRQPMSLADVFRLYPHPRLMGDLWMVLEDARVEACLQREYPGLRQDLQRVASETVTPRDPAHGLTVKELIVDSLLRLSTGEALESAVPRSVQPEVAQLWALCQPLLAGPATAEEAVRLAHGLYLRMEEWLAPKAEMIRQDQPAEETQDAGAGPSGSEDTGGEYRPVTNWVYRGEMNPEYITREEPATREQAESGADLERMASAGGGSKEQGGAAQGARGAQSETMGDVLGGGRALPSVVEEVLALPVDARSSGDQPAGGERSIRYPEWDVTIQDYRPAWCRVLEREGERGSDEPITALLAGQRSVVRAVRRQFERLRPEAFRRVAGQADGDDLDLDALVRRVAEQRAGEEGGDRIYIRHEKHQRDVAVAVLVDMSGSTARQLEVGRRVIDIEKESLVLLCEALEAVGDQYGLYAFSGEGRGQVDFAVLKEFDERLGPVTAQRLGGLLPRKQNRDGAAIRHATAKLRARAARTKLMILLSDGRPLDGDYKDDYSLEDTKAALREARQAGVHPFCVTIDREADAYVRRMYGDVQCAVIDRIEALPAKLPRIYQKLTA